MKRKTYTVEIIEDNDWGLGLGRADNAANLHTLIKDALGYPSWLEHAPDRLKVTLVKTEVMNS